MSNGILSQFDTQAADWPELPTQTLPDFPVDALPDEVAAYCRAVADSIQVAPDMVACFLLGAASAALVGRISVQPIRTSDHREPIQLYLLCRGSPGERKSATLSAVMAPLTAWIADKRREVSQANAGVERKLEVCKRDAQKAKGADLEALLERSDALKEKLLPEPVFPLGDVTVEALTDYMVSHEGKAVLMADEANFLHVLTGRSYQREGGAVNLDAILNGYSGGAASGRRATRGTWYIEHAALSVCVASQPHLLEGFAHDPTGTGRGLQGRFLYFLPASKVGLRAAIAPPVPDALTAWWTDTLKRLANLPEGTLTFDKYAERDYIAWWTATEARLRTDLDGVMLEWGGKLCGNVVRLAGLLALLDRCSVVQSIHWGAAQAIADSYLIPCAKRLFCGEDDRLTADASALLDRLQEGVVDADFWREHGRHILKNDRPRYAEAMRCLQLAGYLRAEQRVNSNGKTSLIVRLNPALMTQTEQAGEVMTL